jgi:PAS domain S-box-containing protein
MMETLQRRARELEALQATVLDITLPHDLPTLLETIVERAARLLGARSGGLYLCEPDQERVVCVVSYQTPHDYRGTTLRYGEGAAGVVAQTGNPLIIDDYRFWGDRAPIYEEEQPFRAVLAVPMIWQARVTGVIDVVHYAEGRLFTRNDLELLTLFANHAAIAVENARLYDLAQAEIAHRRQLEQQIEERRRYLEGVLACAPDAIVALDAQHHVLEWNGGAETLFGYSRQEAVGRDVDDLIAVFDTATFEEATSFTRQVLGGEPVPPTETVRYSKDGTPINVILAGAPILAGDKLMGVVAIYTDITRRKRVEEETRRQAQELEAAVTRLQELDHLKSEFMQNVSHELRTPLSLIWGYSDLLVSGELGELSAEQRGPVESIVRQSQTLIALVQDITIILSTEGRILKREPVSLAELVRATASDFDLLTEQAGLTVRLEIAPDLPPVSGGPIYLRRVVDNLLDNAIKFTPAGGTVTVRLQRQDDRAILQVADNGIGIPPDEQKHIFERFYQVDGTAHRRYGGAGIGLALVKEIVEAYDGTVGVESRPGEGSTFTITLPCLKS